MFYLSGAVNALLLLIVRSQLLLLTRPRVDDQPEFERQQPAPQIHEVNGWPDMGLPPRRSTGDAANAAVPDIPLAHSPEPAAAALLEAGSSNNTAPKRTLSV